MRQKPCRDCGQMLAANARGCPQCALNVEAERMIDRIVVGVIAVVAFVVGAGAIYLMMR